MKALVCSHLLPLESANSRWLSLVILPPECLSLQEGPANCDIRSGKHGAFRSQTSVETLKKGKWMSDIFLKSQKENASFPQNSLFWAQNRNTLPIYNMQWSMSTVPGSKKEQGEEEQRGVRPRNNSLLSQFQMRLLLVTDVTSHMLESLWYPLGCSLWMKD